jgi:hypothetical protein
LILPYTSSAADNIPHLTNLNSNPRLLSNANLTLHSRSLPPCPSYFCSDPEFDFGL